MARHTECTDVLVDVVNSDNNRKIVRRAFDEERHIYVMKWAYSQGHPTVRPRSGIFSH